MFLDSKKKNLRFTNVGSPLLGGCVFGLLYVGFSEGVLCNSQNLMKKITSSRPATQRIEEEE